MFGKRKIGISPLLYSKLEKASRILACSSVEEYAIGVLEKDSDRVLSKSGRKTASKEEVDDIARKLQGLGYID